MSETLPDGPEINDVRLDLLRIIRARVAQLFSSEAASREDYFLGQEYVEDDKLVECTIVVTFLFPGMLEDVAFWHNKCRIAIRQYPPVIEIEIHRMLPCRLWDELRYLNRGDLFVIGYIAALMPAINRKLLDNRYLSGHPLSRTFFLLDALAIQVVVEGERLSLRWPISVGPFPPSAALAPGCDQTYLRDFIDAMHSLLKYDYDDCIRRVITSAECFFTHKSWNAGTPPSGLKYIGWLISGVKNLISRKSWSANAPLRTFRRILEHNVDPSAIAGQVIIHNLKIVYGVRNKIVHRGFRMSMTSGVFCHKAISTLKYLIYRYSGDPVASQYVYQLEMQFLALQGLLGVNYNLDHIGRRVAEPLVGIPRIERPEDLENHMFNSLRITASDRSAIL